MSPPERVLDASDAIGLANAALEHPEAKKSYTVSYALVQCVRTLEHLEKRLDAEYCEKTELQNHIDALRADDFTAIATQLMAAELAGSHRPQSDRTRAYDAVVRTEALLLAIEERNAKLKARAERAGVSGT